MTGKVVTLSAGPLFADGELPTSQSDVDLFAV